MFKANLYDAKIGSFRMIPFRSLALLLARAKQDEKFVIKVYNGSEEMLCKYDPRQGWIIGKPSKSESK